MAHDVFLWLGCGCEPVGVWMGCKRGVWEWYKSVGVVGGCVGVCTGVGVGVRWNVGI